MLYSIQYIAEALKKARLKKGLSQRELSLKVKIPQSHISKIEKGDVDLQISSLIELARTLELEVMLVPRQLVMIVEAMQQPNRKDKPLYQLDEESDE